MQDINHGKYINYLISQSNSEIDAATSTARKRGGREREGQREEVWKISVPCGPAGNATTVQKGRGKMSEQEKNEKPKMYSLRVAARYKSVFICQ